MLSSCSVARFKSQLDVYLENNIEDLPCMPGLSNSLDIGKYLHDGHCADDLVANQM